MSLSVHGRNTSSLSVVDVTDMSQFDSQPVSLYVGTWNVGKCDFPTLSLGEFIPPEEHDIYVIGLQECSRRDQWQQQMRYHMYVSSRVRLSTSVNVC